MSAQTLVRSLFKYKAWANEELFAEFAKVDPEVQPSGRNAVMAQLHSY
jgi:uncharacterized damage-inducible protein DinB